MKELAEKIWYDVKSQNLADDYRVVESIQSILEDYFTASSHLEKWKTLSMSEKWKPENVKKVLESQQPSPDLEAEARKFYLNGWEYCLEEHDEGGYLGQNEDQIIKMLSQFARQEKIKVLMWVLDKADDSDHLDDLKMYITSKLKQNER